MKRKPLPAGRVAAQVTTGDPEAQPTQHAVPLSVLDLSPVPSGTSAPQAVAETFRVLEGLHPGRIDLGIGRAPGTDQLTALALRRSREALTVDDFPSQLAEMLAFDNADFPETHPFRAI